MKVLFLFACRTNFCFKMPILGLMVYIDQFVELAYHARGALGLISNVNECGGRQED